MSLNLSSLSIASLTSAANELRVAYYPTNETERKVYEALSSKNWGASTTLMNEIATDTMDYEKYSIVMKTIWSTLDSPGRSWKQIFKALTLIEFLVKNGAERTIEESRDHMHSIRPLQDFNYYEGTVDKGSGVREKSKQLLELLSSNEMIRNEREKARRLRDKFIGISNSGGYANDNYSGGSSGGYGGKDSYSSGGIGSGGGGTSSWDSDKRYGGSGGNSYNNSGGSKYDDKKSETTRYGGGSYDGSRPARYGDDTDNHRGGGGGGYDRDNRDHNRDNRDKDQEVDDEEVETHKPVKSTSKTKKTTSTSNASSSGGKFKVTIKDSSVPAPAVSSAPAPVHKTAAVVEPTIDFFGSSSTSTVDLFNTPIAPAPVPAPAPASSFGGFDAFGPSTPAFQTHPTPVAFDPFASTAAPVPVAFPPQSNTFSSPLTQPFPTSSQQQQQQFQNFGSQQFGAFAQAAPSQPIQSAFPAVAPSPSQGLGLLNIPSSSTQTLPIGGSNLGYGLATGNTLLTTSNNNFIQSQPQQQYISQQPQNSTNNTNEHDFGDFEGANTSSNQATNRNDTTATATPATNKWAGMNSLIDLGSLSTNNDNKGSQVTNKTLPAGSNSFAGLDGFSKGSVTMVGGAISTLPLRAQPPMQSNQVQSTSSFPIRQQPSTMAMPFNQPPHPPAMGMMNNAYGGYTSGAPPVPPNNYGGGMGMSMGGYPQQQLQGYQQPQAGFQQQQQLPPNPMLASGQQYMGGGGIPPVNYSQQSPFGVQSGFQQQQPQQQGGYGGFPGF